MVAARPRVEAPENLPPQPSSICDLLSATKQLGKVECVYEVASVIAGILLSTAIGFMVLNYASVLKA